MGFLKNLREKGVALEIGNEAKCIFGAASQLPKDLYQSLAHAVERNIGKIMDEEAMYLKDSNVDQFLKNLDAGREVGLTYSAAGDDDVRMRGIADWLVSAYWRTKYGATPQMLALNEQLKDVIDRIAYAGLSQQE